MDVDASSTQQQAVYWPTGGQNALVQVHSSFPQGAEPQTRLQQPLSQPTVTPTLSQGNILLAARNGSQKRRACNECRQQKLRCDLSRLEPDSPDSCSRCRRLGLECRIDDRFKRTRKRKRSTELEKEVEQLRRQLSTFSDTQAAGSRGERPLYDGQHSEQVSGIGSDAGNTTSIVRAHHASEIFATTLPNMTSPDATNVSDPPGTTTRPFPEEHPEQAEGNGVLAQTLREPSSRVPRSLGNIELSADEIDEMFTLYFTYYHRFLPILDSEVSPVRYYESSALLFWSIISVAARRFESDPTLLTRLARSVTSLTWRALQSIPHSKSVVQSLVLLCTWPFPTSSSTADVSYMWAGTMMQISIQMGLHRPMNPQDFTKFHIKLNDSEVAERVRTWAACNIIAQSVSIGAGLSAPVHYDWALIFASRSGSRAIKLDPELESHLRIEMFRNNVSRSMASNVADPVGLLSTQERLPLYKIFAKDLESIEGFGGALSDINRLYIRAARLHLHAFFLFDEPDSESYTERIIMLYFTATSLIQHILDTDKSTQMFLRYCPFFIYQTFVSASFVILKVLKNTYFAAFLDVDAGKKLFNASVTAIRKMSVANNDLPGRLGDVLAYLWTDTTPNLISGPGKDGLQLNIRSRMSMSVVFDSLWRWRQQFRAHGRSDTAIDQDNENDNSALESTVPPQINLDENTSFVPNATFFDSFGPFDFALDTVDFGLLG